MGLLGTLDRIDITYLVKLGVQCWDIYASWQEKAGKAEWVLLRVSALEKIESHIKSLNDEIKRCKLYGMYSLGRNKSIYSFIY